jgi:hypothetical protein
VPSLRRKPVWCMSQLCYMRKTFAAWSCAASRTACIVCRHVCCCASRSTTLGRTWQRIARAGPTARCSRAWTQSQSLHRQALRLATGSAGALHIACLRAPTSSNVPCSDAHSCPQFALLMLRVQPVHQFVGGPVTRTAVKLRSCVANVAFAPRRSWQVEGAVDPQQVVADSMPETSLCPRTGEAL